MAPPSRSRCSRTDRSRSMRPGRGCRRAPTASRRRSTALLDQLDGAHGYVAVQAYLDRHRDASLASLRDALGHQDRAARHVRLGTPVPALHRAVPQGRARNGRLPAGHRAARGRPGRPGPALHLPRVPDRPGGRATVRCSPTRAAPSCACTSRARPTWPTYRRRWREQTDHRPPEPAAGSRGPADAPDRRSLRDGDLRRHRRPRATQGDAGDLRPGQPRTVAARLQRRRLRATRLGGPGLRADRARLGQGTCPDGVPRGGLAPARRGDPLRAGRLLRRPRLREAAPDHRGARRGSRHRRQPRLLPRHPARVVRRRGRPAQGARTGRADCRVVAPRGDREALRSRPGVGTRAEPDDRRRCSRRSRSSGSTTTSARRPSRTSSP